MPKVRVKHPTDPDARISNSEGPDDKGGFLIDDTRIEAAACNGFNLVHYHEEVDAEPEVPVEEELPPVVPEPEETGDEETGAADDETGDDEDANPGDEKEQTPDNPTGGEPVTTTTDEKPKGQKRKVLTRNPVAK